MNRWGMPKFVCVFASLVLFTTQAWASSSYPYQRCFEVAARMHDVPLDLLLAVAATESNWDADARSKANAHGIMQIQWPGTAKHLGVRRVGELYNPCLNISLGARYLNELLVTFNQSEQRALGAYNYGPTRIKATSTLPNGAQNYVNKVLEHRRKINTGLVPKKLQPASSRQLMVFDSKTRAKRMADKLHKNLTGATINVQQLTAPKSGYAINLAIGASGLTAADHVWLQHLGLAQ